MIFRDQFHFLSNFYSVPIETKWGVFSSAEHLYQACKFTDVKERERVRRHPGKGLKSFCRTLTSFDPKFNDKRLTYMKEIIHRKFDQNPWLQYKLASVEGIIVEENTWHDNYWGDCICTKRKQCNFAKGQNHLGVLLMQERKNYIHLLEA